MKFKASIAYWKPEKNAGLAVAYVPTQLIERLGGLKQKRVHGRVNGTEFVSSVWPAGAGRLALNVSKKMMGDAGVGVGDEARFEITSGG